MAHNKLLQGIHLFALLGFCYPMLSYGDSKIVVRNGHHRAIAVIVLLKNSQIDPDTVVGEFEDRPITAGELLNWYESGRLRAYNESHSPSKAEDLVASFDPSKALAASEMNPPGGIIFTRPRGDEKLKPFREMRQHGSFFPRPDCGDLMERLVPVAR
jgi:hypothetical protein